MVELLLLPPRWPSRTKRIGKLFDREDTLRIVSRRLLQCHAAQESKVISLHGLGSAKLLELTHFAMAIQREQWLAAGALESQTRQNGS